MTAVELAWMTAGVFLGAFHSTALWKSAKRPGDLTAIVGMARLGIVGATLTAAAVLGGLLPAFLGWILGFLACAALVLWRRGK